MTRRYCPLYAAVMAGALATPVPAAAQTGGAPPAPPPAASGVPTIATPAAPGGGAAAGTTATIGPPVRRIETASAVSNGQLGAITTVRQLSNGRVLLNDGTRRRLLLLDSTLAIVRVVLDSLTEVQNAYGTRIGSLIAYRGDSTLFVDPATYAMLVIDGEGSIARVRSVPRAQDVSYMAGLNTSYGLPGFDGQGRLVYRIPAQSTQFVSRVSSDMPNIPQQADSAFVIGISLDTRKIDTLGSVRIPRQVLSAVRSENGFEFRSAQSPLPLVDDWAVLSDGTVAFVRGRDFRVDFRAPDGTVTSSEKLPFPWVRLQEDDKIKFVDSVKTVQTRNAQRSYLTEMIVWSNVLNKPYPASFKVIPDLEVPPGLPNDWILPGGLKFPANYVYACPPAVPGAPPPLPAAGQPVNAAPGTGNAPRCVPNNYNDWFGSGYTPPPPTYRPPTLIPATEMPDYKPPIGIGSVRADADGNLWIRTMPMRPVAGGTVYDIVSRKGELVDRVQLPTGYALAGFGAGRVVYLGVRDATGLHLARVRLR